MLLFFSRIAYAQTGRIGLRTNSPVNDIEANGWFQITGNQNSAGITNEATLRFNTVKSCIEVYQGGVWGCLVSDTGVAIGADHDFYKVGTTSSPTTINDNLSGKDLLTWFFQLETSHFLEK